MTQSPETVVIVIPTYNEADNIERVIDILSEHIFPKLSQKYTPHILIVDDSSPDGTGEIVENLRTRYDHLHLLTNAKKAGLGKAYTVGMKYALEKLGADIVFEFDADLSHDPKKIPTMLKKLSEGYDMAVGSRYIPGGSIPKNWGLHRKFLSYVGNIVSRILITDFEIHDWTGGFRALNKHVVKAILPHMDRDEFTGYTFQIGFLLQARRAGFKIAEVPFHFKDRTHGKSKMPPSYISTTLQYIMKVRLKEFSQSRVAKFITVGLVGATIQITSLQLFRTIFSFQVAYFFSVEMAIISNFTWSNLWTFKDRRLNKSRIPLKFLQFNLTSSGSLLIQQILAYFGEKYIGLYPLFTVPATPVVIDTGVMIAVVGIMFGMMWNFFAYSKIIWRVNN